MGNVHQKTRTFIPGVYIHGNAWWSKNYIYNSFEFNTWHLNSRKLIIKLAGRLLPKSLWYFFAGVDVPMEIKMFGPKSAVKQFAWVSFIPQSSFRKAIPAVWSRRTSCRGADHLRSVWIGWECVPLGRELSPIPVHARSCQSSPVQSRWARYGPFKPVRGSSQYLSATKGNGIMPSPSCICTLQV